MRGLGAQKPCGPPCPLSVSLQLEVLTNLANETNTPTVLREFQVGPGPNTPTVLREFRSGWGLPACRRVHERCPQLLVLSENRPDGPTFSYEPKMEKVLS